MREQDKGSHMTRKPGRRQGRRIQAVETSLDILDVLQDEGSTGVTELAETLDHSKSTIHSHLRTLEDRQLIVEHEDGYRLSLGVLEMARSVRKQVGNYEVIKNGVGDLVEETDEVAQFGLMEYGKVSYLYKETGDFGVETASRVGTQQPMHSTSLGKTILAYLPEDETRDIVSELDFEKYTSNTITSIDEFYTEIEQIREQGYGVDDEENIEGLRCVATPVKNDETVLGAVSVSGPSRRMTLSRIHDSLADEVQRVANVIELNTKFA